jgi:hypothetical protein
MGYLILCRLRTFTTEMFDQKNFSAPLLISSLHNTYCGSLFIFQTVLHDRGASCLHRFAINDVVLSTASASERLPHKPFAHVHDSSPER